MQEVGRVYHAQGGEATVRIRPRGFQPHTACRMRSTDQATTTTHIAEALPIDGVEVVLGEFGGEMLWLQTL